MTKLKIDYSEARDWYIKGYKDKEGIKYPSNTLKQQKLATLEQKSSVKIAVYL